VRRNDQILWGSVLGTLTLGFLVVWLAPIDVSGTIRFPAKLFAERVWTLERSGQGTLTARLEDRVGGVSSRYLVQSVQRGDIAQFVMESSVRLGARLGSGDTVGVFTSTRSDRELAELVGHVSVASAETETFSEGAKQTLIDKARSRLEKTLSLLDLQRRIVSRLRILRDSELVSTDEVDRAAREEVALEGEIKVIEAQIEVLGSGARPSEQRLATSRVQAGIARLLALERQRDAFAIITPIAGIVTRPAGDSVLVRLTDISSWVVVIPVPLADRDLVAEGSELTLSIGDDSSSCSVIHVDRTVSRVAGISSVLASCRPDRVPDSALDGTPAQVEVGFEPVRLRTRVLEMVSGLFRWKTWVENAPRG